MSQPLTFKHYTGKAVKLQPYCWIQTKDGSGQLTPKNSFEDDIYLWAEF